MSYLHIENLLTLGLQGLVPDPSALWGKEKIMGHIHIQDIPCYSALMLLKQCSKCKAEKDSTEFHKAKGNSDGLQKWCKKCDNDRCLVYQRARQRRLGRKERAPQRLVEELKVKGLKRCPGCKETKPLASFYESENSNGGRASHCIICANTQNAEKRKEYAREQYLRTKEKEPDRVYNNRLKKKFGITIENYNQRLAEQNGLCAVCGEAETHKRLAVDHNHKTGQIRGLLCGRCNPAVGYLRDSAEIARKIADYLDSHRKA